MNDLTPQFLPADMTLRSLLMHTNGTAIYAIPHVPGILLRLCDSHIPGSDIAHRKDMLASAHMLRPTISAAEHVTYGKTLYRIATDGDFSRRRGKATHDYGISIIARGPDQNVESWRTEFEAPLAGDKDYKAKTRATAQENLAKFEFLASAPQAAFTQLLEDLKTILAAGHDIELRRLNFQCGFEPGKPETIHFFVIDAGSDGNPHPSSLNPKHQTQTLRYLPDMLPAGIAANIMNTMITWGSKNAFSASETRAYENAQRTLTQKFIEAGKQTDFPVDVPDIQTLYGSQWSRRPGLKPAEKPAYRPISMDAPGSAELFRQDVERRLTGHQPGAVMAL